MARYVCIWFRHLLTDQLSIRRPELRHVAFVVASPVNGRLLIKAANEVAQAHGIWKGMAAADAKALVPDVVVVDATEGKELRLLKALGEWCIRYTPVVGIQMDDGLLLQADGCTHLLGGEAAYLRDILSRLTGNGYAVQGAIADTIGAAWAMARYKESAVVPVGRHIQEVMELPPSALRLNPVLAQKLQKLGFRTIQSFINLQRSALRRRFGNELLEQLDLALGNKQEYFEPVHPPVVYQERLPCLEPLRTAQGIEVALEMLLSGICKQFEKAGVGARVLLLKCYRVDGCTQEIRIGTNKPNANSTHLYKLLNLQVSTIKPGLGIELFVLDATHTEPLEQVQEAFWTRTPGLIHQNVSELMDRLAIRLGPQAIQRYLPAPHHWPERSYTQANNLSEEPSMPWGMHKVRPVKILPKPEPIKVTAPVPDYPPMLFIYKSVIHKVRKADGPERIEREWWLDAGEHRDYYRLEDEAGKRYWIFRSGHYREDRSVWFIHGFFS